MVTEGIRIGQLRDCDPVLQATLIYNLVATTLHTELMMKEAVGAGTARKFRYKTRGWSVTLGKHQGTTQVRQLLFTGPLAWWMGRSYHLLMLPGYVRRAIEAHRGLVYVDSGSHGTSFTVLLPLAQTGTEEES